MTIQRESIHNMEIVEDDWVTDYEWLGIVYDGDWDRSEARSLITPLAYYDIYDNQWRVLSEVDRKQIFPNNGKVVQFHNGFGLYPLEVKRLYQFHPVTNLKEVSQENVNHSRFIAFDAAASQSLSQILDWTKSLSTVFDLPAFLERGIPIDSCYSRIIYIRYAEYLYGPLQLEAEGDLLKAREYLSPNHSGGKPLLLQKYLFSEQSSIGINGQLYLDARSIGVPLGKIDCSLPQVTVKAALHAYKNVKDRATSERLVDKTIKELAALHSSTNPGAPVIESCTLERAQYIVKSHMKMIDDLQKVLADLPEDHALLLTARDHVLQHQKSEIEQELQQYRNSTLEDVQKCKKTMEEDVARASAQSQSRLHFLQLEADSVEQKCAIAQAELDNILQKTKQARAQFKQQQHEFKIFEQYRMDSLDQLRQEPLRVLADLQITSALQRALFESFAQDHAVVSSIAQPMAQETQVDAHSVIEQSPMVEQGRAVVPQPQFFPGNVFSELPSFKSLLTAAKQSGVTDQSARVIAASLLAGLIPAVEGPVVVNVLQAVAQTIAGDRLWSIPVPLTALAPLDLFGTIASDTRQFIPVGDLADIIFEARNHPQQLGIVLLEGVDRAPFQTVIAPIVQQYHAIRQQKQHATDRSISPLRLFHPRAIAHDDPYQALASFCWPANLLLAVTLDQTPGSFILPAAYASFFMPHEIEEAASTDLGHPVISQFSADDWHGFEKEIFHGASAPPEKELPESIAWQELKAWQKVFVISAHKVKMSQNRLSEVMSQHHWGVNDDESEQ